MIQYIIIRTPSIIAIVIVVVLPLILLNMRINCFIVLMINHLILFNLFFLHFKSTQLLYTWQINSLQWYNTTCFARIFRHIVISDRLPINLLLDHTIVLVSNWIILSVQLDIHIILPFIYAWISQWLKWCNFGDICRLS